VGTRPRASGKRSRLRFLWGPDCPQTSCRKILAAAAEIDARNAAEAVWEAVIDSLAGDNAAAESPASVAAVNAARDDAFAEFSAKLVEFRFLIPILGNNAPDDPSNVHGRQVWDAFESQLTELAGGFTAGYVVRGAWQDNNGRIVRDNSIPYTVAISVDREQALRELLANACHAFRQECIYLACGAFAELVYAS